jgi:hypothetical protein
VQISQLDQESLVLALQADPLLKYSKSHKKVYYRAFATDTEVLFKEQLKENSFRYKCITGKRDRNKGTWYGLVKPMLDPQRFTNKLYSEILHIVRTNANGGMALEEDAVEDVRQFESTWASTDKITWLKSGSLSGAHGSKMLPKSAPPVQAALFQLMDFAQSMVKSTTGVNEEILGLVGREQAGVLEQQRKQAAYGILSSFFDAKRRYQREQGKLLLAQMREYFPPDKLVRIVDKGTSQYVQLALALETQQYDIVVDEAPAGPDQKAKILAVLMPLLPQLLQAGLIGPDALAQVIQFLPLPAAVANQLAQAVTMQQQRMQMMAQPQQAMQAAVLQNKQADTGKKSADATLANAKAFAETTMAHAKHMDLLDPMSQPMQAMPGTPGGPSAGPPIGGPPAGGAPIAPGANLPTPAGVQGPPPGAPGGPSGPPGGPPPGGGVDPSQQG